MKQLVLELFARRKCDGTEVIDGPVRLLANLRGTDMLLERAAARPATVIATPHRSGHARQTFVRRATEIAEIINAFQQGREPSNALQRGLISH